jgi:hypothetical protein
MNCPASSPNTSALPAAPSTPAWTGSSCTSRTGTCCTSSSFPASTPAPTRTAVRRRIAPASSSRRAGRRRRDRRRPRRHLHQPRCADQRHHRGRQRRDVHGTARRHRAAGPAVPARHRHRGDRGRGPAHSHSVAEATSRRRLQIAQLAHQTGHPVRPIRSVRTSACPRGSGQIRMSGADVTRPHLLGPVTPTEQSWVI